MARLRIEFLLVESMVQEKAIVLGITIMTFLPNVKNKVHRFYHLKFLKEDGRVLVTLIEPTGR